MFAVSTISLVHWISTIFLHSFVDAHAILRGVELRTGMPRLTIRNNQNIEDTRPEIYA